MILFIKIKKLKKLIFLQRKVFILKLKFKILISTDVLNLIYTEYNLLIKELINLSIYYLIFIFLWNLSTRNVYKYVAKGNQS